MDDFNLNSKYKRYRKRKDSFKNVILELTVRYGSTDRQVCFLRLTQDSKSKFNFKKEANLFVRRLAREGKLAHFSLRDQKNAELHGKLPQGYLVDFIIPPSVGGSYSADNLYVVPRDISKLMYDLYWHQVAVEFNAFTNKDKIHNLGVELPRISSVFLQKDFFNFIPGYEKQEIEKYLNRKKQWREAALKHVMVKQNKRDVVLQFSKKKKPPEGMKYGLVKAHIPSMMERIAVRQEYLHNRREIIQGALKRGDFDHLSDKIKEHIIRTEHMPESADLTCHHILPRSLGGTNSLDNMCWLSKNDHLRLHRHYIDPFIEYLDGCFDEERNIFIEIPVPINTKIPLFAFSKRRFISLLSSKRGCSVK